jgi:hypothetical protein
LVVQPAQDWQRQNAADGLDGAQHRAIERGLFAARLRERIISFATKIVLDVAGILFKPSSAAERL